MKSKLTSVILISAEGLSGFNSPGQHTLESFKTLINDLDRSELKISEMVSGYNKGL
jgi:hypothetical protein